LDASTFEISVEHLNGCLILARIANEDSHHANLTLASKSSSGHPKYLAARGTNGGTFPECFC
jgi:hypothetical protein